MPQRSARGAQTLPQRFYVSAEIFERERRRIFGRRWLCIGHRSELAAAGSFKLLDLAPESVVVLCDGDGSIRAFHNVCRHRGCRLVDGDHGSLPGAIRCPYHSWTYRLDGSLKAAPNMADVPGFELSDHSLVTASVGEWLGFVFVNLGDAPPSLEDEMQALSARLTGWHLPELESAHRTLYEVEANWKLLFQNYSECYHCPGVHPRLNRLTPYRDTVNDLEEGSILGGPMTLAADAGSMTMSGARCAPALAGVDGEDLSRIYYYTIFPNMFLSLHPDYVLVHRSQPLGPALTRITCDWLFHREVVADPDFDPSDAVEFWDMTNRQDWELCTLSQRGISTSAYQPGPYSELESQLAAFDREYLLALGSDRNEPPGSAASDGREEAADSR